MGIVLDSPNDESTHFPFLKIQKIPCYGYLHGNLHVQFAESYYSGSMYRNWNNILSIYWQENSQYIIFYKNFMVTGEVVKRERLCVIDITKGVIGLKTLLITTTMTTSKLP